MKFEVSATPSLELRGKICISYVFTGQVKRFADEHIGIDLNKVRAMLGKNQHLHAYEAYVVPLDAFISDACDTALGGTHFPLIMQLYPNSGNRDRHTTFHFRSPFEYEAEGRHMRVSGTAPEAHCKFRESFALFESGRYYFTISFFQEPHAPNSLDEYAVLQLLQIANDGSQTSLGAERRTLLEFVNARFASARANAGNCIFDVAMALCELKAGDFTTFTWDSFSHSIVHIDDQEIFKLTTQLSETLGHHGDALRDHSPVQGAAHINGAFPQEVKQLMALAGICQNVPDFPYQDGSEIADSLTPVHGDGYVQFFFKQKLFLEFSTSSRSLRQGRNLIGGCPYLFCVCLLIRYDEALIEEAIAQMRTLAYSDVQGESAVRVFGDLFDALRMVNVPLIGSGGRAFMRMTRAKLKLLSDIQFRFLSSPFRYPTEREMFRLALEQRSILRRFEDVSKLIEHQSQRVDEIQRIGDTTATKRLGTIMALLTLVQVLALHNEIGKLFPGAAAATIYAAAAAAAFCVMVLLGSAFQALLNWRSPR